MDDITEKMTLEDFSEEHREIAEIIGVDNLLKLSEHFGGMLTYIPTKNKLIKNTIYQQIIKEFDGTNKRKLAKKYDVSYTTVRRILNGKNNNL